MQGTGSTHIPVQRGWPCGILVRGLRRIEVVFLLAFRIDDDDGIWILFDDGVWTLALVLCLQVTLEV